MAVLVLTVSAIVSILLGILILVWPRSLNYAVAAWLLFNGLLQILSGYVY